MHLFWDQEDIYGSPAVYEALEVHDRGNDRNFFAAGPWYHGQHLVKLIDVFPTTPPDRSRCPVIS